MPGSELIPATAPAAVTLAPRELVPVSNPARTVTLTAADGRLASLTAAWLLRHARRSAATATAYQRDLRQWLSYCDRASVDPLRARPADLDLWMADQRLRGARGTRAAAEATVARRVAAVSSWYDYLLANSEDDPYPLVARNPVARAGRPRLSPTYSPTIGLTAPEMDRLLHAADLDGATSCALIRLIFTEGLRVGSALAARVEDLGHDQGHRTLEVRVKGRAAGEPDRIPLPPVVATALDAMLAGRGHPETGPLFHTPTGVPIYHMYAYRLVKRIAKAAGLPAADKLTPHGLRHTAITLYLDATGGDVRGAQRFAGHARPETTMRYDRRRKTYSDHGAYVLAQRFGERSPAASDGPAT